MTNQDIFLENTNDKIFGRNSGYEYDASNEKVNEANGHMWDKIILSDGKEGYVFSDNVELVGEEEYSNIEFRYQEKGYDVYFPTLSYGIDIKNYPYYIVAENNKSEIKICFAKAKMEFVQKDGNYQITGGGALAYVVSVHSDGSVTIVKEVNLTAYPQIIKIDDFESKCIVANYDVYCLEKKLFNANIFEYSGIKYKVGGIWENIKTTNAVYETIRQGEELYNSMNQIELLYKYPSLLEQRGTILMMADASQAIFPNGGTALSYFLTKGSSEKKMRLNMKKISMERIIK